jgi:hypothetical protein
MHSDVEIPFQGLATKKLTHDVPLSLAPEMRITTKSIPSYDGSLQPALLEPGVAHAELQAGIDAGIVVGKAGIGDVRDVH